MVEALVEYEYTAEHEDELTIHPGEVITNVVQQDGGWWEGELNGRRGVFPDNFVKVIQRDQHRGSKVMTGGGSIPSNATTNGIILRKGDKKRRCKVLYSYSPQNEDELALNVDDVIEIVEEVEEGWWRGVLKGREGVFPSNFVQEVDYDDGAANEIKPKPIKGVGLGNIFQDGAIKLKSANDNRESKSPSPTKKYYPGNTSDLPALPPRPAQERAKVLFSYDAQNDDELTLKEGDIINIVTKDVEDAGWWKGELNGHTGVFPDNFVELIVDEPKPKRPERPDKASHTLPMNKAPTKDNNYTSDTIKDRYSASLSPNTFRPAEMHRDISGGTTAASQPSRFSSPFVAANAAKKPDIAKKADEKPEKAIAPPLPGKKPQLPPPMKKPVRLVSPQTNSSAAALPPPVSTTTTTASGTSTSPSPMVTATVTTSPSTSPVPSSPVNSSPQTLPITPPPTHPPLLTNDTSGDGKKVDSESSAALKLEKEEALDDFSGVELTSDRLVHLTANRAKVPNRRPPSHLFLQNNTAISEREKENDTAPWMQELKKNQAVRRSMVSSPPAKESSEPEDRVHRTSIGGGGVNNSATRQSAYPSQQARVSNTVTSPNKDTHDARSFRYGAQLLADSGLGVDSPEYSMDSGRTGAHRESANSRMDVDDLRKQLILLQDSFDVHRKTSQRQITELAQDLEQERKARQQLQLELDQLRKLVRK